jgi:tRNA (guanine37-N1)-methyltransferase
MKIDVLTLFPSMFTGPLDESIVRRARDSGILELFVHDIREFAFNKHRTVDDKPFGGGPGMLMKIEPIFEALSKIKADSGAKVVLLDPPGRKLDQKIVRELSAEPHLILICGSYEGFDERVRQHLVDDEISIGDFVLTNGALPAMVIIDAVTRLLPGALGHAESAQSESFTEPSLEYPQYTRPADFKGLKVPDVLLSGNHAAIAKWRQQEAEKRTAQRRPDLLNEETRSAQR